MTLPIGTRVGAFELTGSLGSGGMGEVYRARELGGSPIPEVSIYDVRRESQTKLSVSGVALNPIWVPPQGRYLVFTRLMGVARSELDWKPADGGQPQALLPGIPISSNGSFQGDGKKLAFVSFASSEGGRIVTRVDEFSPSISRSAMAS